MIMTCVRVHSKQIFYTKKSEETRAFVNQNLRVFPSFCKCIYLSSPVCDHRLLYFN